MTSEPRRKLEVGITRSVDLDRIRVFTDAVIVVDKRCRLVRDGGVKTSKHKKPAPNAAELLALAEAERPVIRIKDYLAAVDTLREKGFSWRACAAWLEAKAGIKVDHTSLMRASEDRDSIEEPEEEEEGE